jgi:hypothetical protein
MVMVSSMPMRKPLLKLSERSVASKECNARAALVSKGIWPDSFIVLL